jgi:transposase
MATDASFLIPPALHVDALLLGDDGLTIRAASEATDVRCPVCGKLADRVHSRYRRTLADLPWARFAVRLDLRVRRFFCANPTCPRAIFAERLAGIAEAFAHRTERQRGALTRIAVANGGEAGARLADALGSPVSPDTPLRLIRGAPEADLPTPAVLGVDDWAIHTGPTCGTILVDLERHRPADLRPDRSSEALATWLRAHPGVEVIARDRGGAYAEGARDGAPDAVQVADRWHLGDTLADALEAIFRSKGTRLAAAATALGAPTTPNAASGSPEAGVYQGKRRHPQPERWRERTAAAAAAGVARRRAKSDQARALRASGASVAQIARTAGASRMAVSKYPREGPPQGKRHSIHGKQRVLEPYEPYLLQRWDEGCRLATVLWREIRAQRFAAKPRTDPAAVQAGLTLRHSNGQPEGHVTKLKLVKRQGYGRAKVDLLRKRLPRAA